MEVKADMVGVVNKVLVKAGDKVEENQQVAAVESMKMVVKVPAPSAGTVKEVKIGEGDFVQEGDVLIVIE